MNNNKNKKVAIIGAGFTGLAAANHLAKQGFKVTIFEASSSEGGLASGFELMGSPLERAYHFIYKTDEYMLSLLDELNMLDKLTFHESSISTYYSKKLYSMVTPLDLLKFYPLSFFDRIRAGLVVLYLQRVKNWKKLTSITAIDWLNKFAGKNVTKIIWEPLLRGKFDIYFDQVTMCWLWGRVKQRMDSQKAGAFGEELGYLSGGFNALVEKLKDSIISHDGKIFTSQPISSVHYSESKHSVVLEKNGKDEFFDAALLTVPSNVASSILKDSISQDSKYLNTLMGTKYLDAAVIVFISDQKISNYYWHNINDDSEFVVFLSLTNLIGTDSFKGKHVYYIGDYMTSHSENMHIDKEVLMKKWFNQLKLFFPHFDESLVLEKHLFRFKNAQHIVDIGYEEKIPSMITPCKNVFLSNFSQIFPMDRGTNYAIGEGIKASELIASKLSN